MFAKLSIFVAATLAIAVMAAPGGHENSQGGIDNGCNTGSIQCCNSVQEHTDSTRQFFKDFFFVTPEDLNGQIGQTCSPITAVGIAGGSSCTSSPVCCTSDNFQGAVVLGCNPINANL